MDRRTPGEATRRSRKLRKRQTTVEKLMWGSLRNRKFLGVKFYRQHPIFFHDAGRPRFFIADFYSRELNLVLEIDGKYHDRQKEYDSFRSEVIGSRGVRVVRIANETIEKDLPGVLDTLATVAGEQRAHLSDISPSPSHGEGAGE